MSKVLSLFGKVLGGASGILGGPLKFIVHIIIDRIISAVDEYMKERKARVEEETKRSEIVAKYKASLKAAATTEEREKAFHDYQAALRAISS